MEKSELAMKVTTIGVVVTELHESIDDDDFVAGILYAAATLLEEAAAFLGTE